MGDYVFDPGPPPALQVIGQKARFAVQRIFCVGRNYADHAREMGHDPQKEPPFFFMKPARALVPDASAIPYPPATEDLHFEGELLVALGWHRAKSGHDVPAEQALDLVFGYGAGNDLTRRDLQADAKSARRPWDMAKGFDRSAIAGPLTRASQIPPPGGTLTTHVDGDLRQTSDLSAMIWPVPDLIAHLSRLVTLAPGDLIFTGTPAGVGPLHRGQTCTVAITGLAPARVTIL